jgi:hypothetical protein
MAAGRGEAAEGPVAAPVRRGAHPQTRRRQSAPATRPAAPRPAPCRAPPPRCAAAPSPGTPCRRTAPCSQTAASAPSCPAAARPQDGRLHDAPGQPNKRVPWERMHQQRSPASRAAEPWQARALPRCARFALRAPRPPAPPAVRALTCGSCFSWVPMRKAMTANARPTAAWQAPAGSSTKRAAMSIRPESTNVG